MSNSGNNVENVKKLQSDNNAEYIKSELSKIKEELLDSNINSSNNKKETNTEFQILENSQQVIVFSNDDVDNSKNEVLLLGELLKYLRENKEFSCLMVCRKINKLILNGNVVEVDIGDEYIEEISSNERHVSLISNFFKSKNLDYKIKGKIVIENDIDRLNAWFGGKLVIKPIKNV